MLFEVENVGGYEVRVEDSDGNELVSNYINGNVVVDRGTKEFLIVRFSKVFEAGANPGPGTVLNLDDFSISSSEVQQVWSEAKALELNESYYENYIAVHKEFNLPGRVNFGFIFEVLDGTGFRAEIEIPEGIELSIEGNLLKIKGERNQIMAFLKINDYLKNIEKSGESGSDKEFSEHDILSHKMKNNFTKNKFFKSPFLNFFKKFKKNLTGDELRHASIRI